MSPEGWWFLLFLFINLCFLFFYRTLFLFFYRTLFFLYPLNITFMVINLDNLSSVTTIIMVTIVRLFRIHFIMSATNQKFSFLLTQTQFLLTFLHFVILITVFSIKISLSVFAVNCAYLTRFKIWATSITFPQTCSLTARTIATQTSMMCSILLIVAFTAIGTKVRSVQKRNHTSQPVVVSFIFYQVSDFEIVCHVASKDDSRRHIIYYYQLILLLPHVFSKLFQFFCTAWSFFYSFLPMQLFYQPF